MASSCTLEQVIRDNYAFMSCVLKVHTDNSGWQKTVMKVLNNIHGVHNFKMDEGGMIEVSGKVSPKVLLKMLGKAGKKAEIIWWQFGECSSNLFVPAVPFGYGNYGGFYMDEGHINGGTRYDHHAGYCAGGDGERISYYRDDSYPYLGGCRQQARDACTSHRDHQGPTSCCIMM